MWRPVNASQRFILGVASLVVVLRLFFPVTRQTRIGSETDVGTTILQLLGILILSGAGYYLASFGSSERLRSFLKFSLLLFIWLVFLGALALGISSLGMAHSIQTVNWLWTGVALAGFIGLLWLTWFATSPGRARRLTLVAFVLVVALPLLGFGGHAYQGRLIAAHQTKLSEVVRLLKERRLRIVEGERIGSIELGMSPEDLNRGLGMRFSLAKPASGGLNAYIWYSGDGQVWNAYFDANQRAVILAFGSRLPRSRYM